MQPQKEQCTSEYRVSQNGAHPCVVVPSALATHESVLRLSISRYGEQRTPTAGRGPHHAQWRSSHVRQLYIVRTYDLLISTMCACPVQMYLVFLQAAFSTPSKDAPRASSLPPRGAPALEADFC